MQPHSVFLGVPKSCFKQGKELRQKTQLPTTRAIEKRQKELKGKITGIVFFALKI